MERTVKRLVFNQSQKIGLVYQADDSGDWTAVVADGDVVACIEGGFASAEAAAEFVVDWHRA
ncbi:MAG: hypothetical protein SNJ79_11650 [Sphingomonadaceae bacterium]